MTRTGHVHGDVADGFAHVADAFATAVGPGRPGGAFAAVVDGRTVVDLWAGTARDDGTPWTAGTPCLVFSGTKGMVAVAVLRLVAEGALDLDRPVADYWPAFVAAGKGAVQVADVLAHTAGLPAVTEPMGSEALADPVRIEEALARQAPVTPVGTVTYHALTYGWLVDGVVRHATGRPVAEVFATQVADVLSLQAWIGVPADVAPEVAHVRRADGYALSAFSGPEPPHPLLATVYGNPAVLDADLSSAAFLRAQVPAANGVATARSLARMYGDLVRKSDGGSRLLARDVLDVATRPRGEGADPLTGRALRFGAGFELAGTPSELGPQPDAFGHTGAGGSSHGGWPGLLTGFSFVTSEMRPEAADDRSRTLLAALERAVRNT